MKGFLSRGGVVGWLLLAALLRLAVWGAGARILPPSSDECIAMLMAQGIPRGDFPLLFWAQPYLFPLESYAMAALAWLPPSPLSCRLIALLAGISATWFALRLLPEGQPGWRRVVARLLVVCPSLYLIMLQGFYALPGYATLTLMSTLMPWLALQTRNTGRPGWAGLLGLAAGLSFAAHSLSLCISTVSLLVLLSPGRGRVVQLRQTLAAMGGLAIGLLPFLLAKFLIPGAHELATTMRPWSTLARRLWEPTLTDVLPGVLGLLAVPFPDTDFLPTMLGRLGYPMAAGLALLLGLLVIHRVMVHGTAKRRGQWPEWQAEDILLAISILNLILVALSPRAGSTTFRYLIPAGLAIPLILAILLSSRSGWASRLALLAGCGLLLLQANSTVQTVRAWQDPDFARRVGVPHLAPALQELNRLGIRHAVASYGAAYRITYESGGQVRAAQPYNERFGNWPVPYKAEVDQATRLAYVCTDAIRFLKPRQFERHLRTMNVTAQISTAGHFRIYHDFTPPPVPPRRPLNAASLHAASCTSSNDVFMIDGTNTTRWRTFRAQRANDWVELSWSNTVPLEAVTLVYGNNKDMALSTRLMLARQGTWHPWPETINGELDKFEIRNGHPIYGRSTRRIVLDGVQADGLRLEILQPNPGRDWTLAEVEIEERL